MPGSGPSVRRLSEIGSWTSTVALSETSTAAWSETSDHGAASWTSTVALSETSLTLTSCVHGAALETFRVSQVDHGHPVAQPRRPMRMAQAEAVQALQAHFPSSEEEASQELSMEEVMKLLCAPPWESRLEVVGAA